MRKIFCLLLLLLGSLPVLADDDFSPNGKEPKPKSKAEAEARQRLKDIMEEAFRLHCEWDEDFDNDSIRQEVDRLDRLYCTDEWNELNAAVAVCDSIYHDGDIGFWDSGYWTKGQDLGCPAFGRIVKVKKKAKDKFFIVYSYQDVYRFYEEDDEGNETVFLSEAGFFPVAVDMVYERGNWYIDDFYEFHYTNDFKHYFSGKRGMRAYLKNPASW